MPIFFETQQFWWKASHEHLSAQNPSMNDSQSGNAVPPTSFHCLPPGNSSSLVPPPRLPIGNSNMTSMYCDGAYGPVLLQTAQTCVFKVGFPKTTLKVRVLFDSRNQRSYIRNSVRELLNLDSMIITKLVM